MVGLCLIAVFAIAALSASSASAGPQWAKCEAKAGGKYSDSNCTVKAKKGTGTFELLKASQVSAKRVAEGKSKNIPFTGHNVGSGGVLYAEFPQCEDTGPPFEGHPGSFTREVCKTKSATAERVGEGGGPVIECSSENNTGEAAGTNGIANVHVTFKGCNIFGSIPCRNQGTDEIATTELKGKLGYLNKAAKEVGVLLEPAKKHGTFAEFECTVIKVETSVGVGNSKEGSAYTNSGCTGPCPGTKSTEESHGGYDGVISPIVPVNQETSTFTQEYKVVPVGLCPENTPSAFEGGHLEALEVVQWGLQNPATQRIMWGCAAEEITNVNTPEEAGMIKA